MREGLIIQMKRAVRAIVLAYVVVLLTVALAASQTVLERNARHYVTLDEETLAGIEWIEQHIPGNANIAVYPRSLGRWIEGMTARNAFEVVGPVGGVWAQQTSEALVAAMVFSGNQAIENGNLRFATTYPYGSEAGPVLSVNSKLTHSTGSTYFDVLRVLDSMSSIHSGGRGPAIEMTLAQAEAISFDVTQSSTVIEMVTEFTFSDFAVLRTLTLPRGQRAAFVRYEFGGSEGCITRFEVPMGFVWPLPAITWDGGQMTVEQQRTFGLVQTVIGVHTSGVDWQFHDRIAAAEGLVLEFELVDWPAAIEVRFDVSVAEPIVDAPLNHFVIPDLLRENEIQYIALDTSPPFIIEEDPPGYLVEWLNEAPYYVPLYGEDDVRMYEVVLDYPDNPRTRATAYLGEHIEFLGWSVAEENHSPGEPLNLYLYWRASDLVDDNYKVFAHLLNPQGEIESQQDSQPSMWRHPTSVWRPGEKVIDLHPILVSQDTEPGEYILAIGMYHESSGERVPAYGHQGRRLMNDTIILGSISVGE